MNKCFGLWSKQQQKQHQHKTATLEVWLAVTFMVFISPVGSLLVCCVMYFQRLSFYNRKCFWGYKNTRHTYMFLILFCENYKYTHHTVQGRRELKWHSLYFHHKYYLLLTHKRYSDNNRKEQTYWECTKLRRSSCCCWRVMRAEGCSWIIRFSELNFSSMCFHSSFLKCQCECVDVCVHVLACGI